MEHAKNFKKTFVIFLLMVAGMTGYGQVTTDYVINITDASALCHYTISAGGVTGKGILLSSTVADPHYGDAGVTAIVDGTGTGSFDNQLTGLAANTTYYVRAYTQDGSSPSFTYAYGAVIQFKTYPTGSATFPYVCQIINDRLTDASTLQFDIYIYSTVSGNPLTLNNYQLGFEVHNVGTAAGTLTGTYSSGTSEITGLPPAANLISRADGNHFDVVIPGPPASSSGFLIPYSASGPGTRIGTFTMVHHDASGGPATPFPAGVQLNMVFDFDVLGKTVIYALSGGVPVLATNNASHIPNEINRNNFYPSNNYGLNSAIWKGTTDTGWGTAANWTSNPATGITLPPTSPTPVFIPGAGSNITNFPVVSGNLTVGAGGDAGSVTIAPGGSLTVTGTLTNTAGASAIMLESDPAGTGSLIAGSSSTGSATAERWMKSGKWNIVSSPLNQTIAGFLGDVNNAVIPTSSVGSLRGMMDYNPATNNWNTFFATGAAGNIGGGKGFSIRVGTADAAITFTGSIQAGTISPAVTPTGTAPSYGWNCVGNPYTSAIGMTVSAGNFLTVNSAKIDPAYGVYMWEAPDASNGGTGGYTAYSNTNALNIQQGQAFFVKINNSATSVEFNQGMQLHNPVLGLKSAENPWPNIKLTVAVGSQKSSTSIAFNSSMTKGLDPTYDAGLLKGGTDLLVYSKLVEDYGIPFAIQALPTDDISKMVIPIGLDFKTGGEVTFSAELLNLPKECKAILEDKVTKTFTDLASGVYQVTVPANSVITDRFVLHTGDLVSGLNPEETMPGELKAYAVSSTEIRVVGDLRSNAVATLYDVSGKTILSRTLYPDILNIIPTPNLKQGLYVLSVKESGRSQTFKILIRE